MAGQFRRLIEAPCYKSSPVQWHGYDIVTLFDHAVAGAQHPDSHRADKIQPIEIFQLMNELARSALMNDS